MTTKPALNHLDTVDAVIDALGGTAYVKKLTGGRSVQSVNNWKYRGAFASNTYAVMIEVLHERGYDAPPELWGQVSDKPQASAAESAAAV